MTALQNEIKHNRSVTAIAFCYATDLCTCKYVQYMTSFAVVDKKNLI